MVIAKRYLFDAYGHTREALEREANRKAARFFTNTEYDLSLVGDVTEDYVGHTLVSEGIVKYRAEFQAIAVQE